VSRALRYYIVFLIAEGFLPASQRPRLFWMVTFAVMPSVVVHGVGARGLLGPSD